MSGLNKANKTKTLNRMVLLVGVSYFAIVVILAILIYRVPIIYQKMNDQRILEIKDDISLALEQSSERSQEEALQHIIDNETLDLVVLRNNDVVVSTVSLDRLSNLQESVNQKALAYQAAYPHATSNGQEYRVWVAIYKFEPQDLFNQMMFSMVAIIGILFLLITLLVFFMLKKLFSPIKRLRDNIFKLKAYRLSEISSIDEATEFDILSEELSDFTEDLRGRMDSFGVKYSLLENELQANREQSIYKEELLSAFAHDLKTPFNVSLFQIEKIEKMAEDNSNMLAEIEGLKQRNEKILGDINELLTIINSDNSQEYKKLKDVDIVSLFRATLRLFQPIFTEKDIQYYVDIPSSLILYISEVDIRQLLHNIISNVCQYTDIGGNFEFSIYEENNIVYLEAYNDKSDISMIDFEHVFELFYTVKGNNHTFGSGIGMHTMKSMVTKYGGTITFAPKEDGVQLSIQLPKVKRGEPIE